MAAKRRQAKHPEVLRREGMITRWDALVGAHAAFGHISGRVGYADIEARGNFAAALNGVTAFNITLTRDTEENVVMSSDQIGAVKSVKTEVSVSVYLDPDEHAVALALAHWNRPVFLRLDFDKSRNGYAPVRSFLLSTRPFEQGPTRQAIDD